MNEATGTASGVSVEEAAAVALELYGLEAHATPLPGERDLNFRLRDAHGASFILKLHNPDADPDVLDMQDRALQHIAELSDAPPAPRVVRNREGHLQGRRPVGDSDRIVRLLTWLDGRPWRDCAPHEESRMADLGRQVALLDAALADFSHPSMRRHLLWNLTTAPEVRQWSKLVDEPLRPAVEVIFARFDKVVAPRMAELPQQVIHNDANELNILVGADGAVAGLIDFGDMVFSVRAAGLAVAGAYGMQGQLDPVRAITPLVCGYDQVTPLTMLELELLFDLMRTRLAMSVCMSYYQLAADPDNEYLTVSQEGVTELLLSLADFSPDLAHFRFRDGCGYEPNPVARRVRQHFESGAARPCSVLDVDVARAPAITLGPGSAGFDPLDPADLAAAIQSIADRISRAGVGFAIGRYGERRAMDRTPTQFMLPADRRRTVHLGVDLFAAAGAPVRAPLDGVVHGVAVHEQRLDYGGVVILEHATTGGVPFWTLFGHLSPSSISHLKRGQQVSAADEIGRLGDIDENGGWPPHLHLQLLTSLVDAATDVPGVGAAEEADLWTSISPDPNLVLGRPAGDAVRTRRDARAIARRRRTNLSHALSLSYSDPLHIVRGEGAYLYDSDGRRWLDLVNNVCHVGHCHPRVVAAGQRQMERLNTNTRYLHNSVISYARRLVATLPDPLRVVMFVNSGSEANDLALRLALAHTGQRDVLVLDHAYHGNLSSLIDLSPYKFDRAGGSGKPPTTHICELPDPYRGRLRDGQATGGAYAANLPATLEAIGRPPAAFFAESLQSCGGQILYPAGYLREAFAAVRAAGGVCVADEVQVGLGRVGRHFWGFELQDVVPDIVTMGKPMGNGHPLAAVATTPQIAASFATGTEYFNTFGGNPVSAEIGLAVLDVIRDQRLQAHAAELGAFLTQELRTLQKRHPLVGDVRGEGLFLGVELSLDDRDRAPATKAARLVKEAVKARGVLISTDGPDDNVLKLKPPMVIGREDCELFLGALDEALHEVSSEL